MKTLFQMIQLANELELLHRDKNNGAGVSNPRKVSGFLLEGDWEAAVWVAKSGASVVRFYPEIEEFYLANGLLQPDERWGR